MENMTKIHTECVLAFEHFQRMNSSHCLHVLVTVAPPLLLIGPLFWNWHGLATQSQQLNIWL